jgi:hypothetical protein
LIIVAKLDAAGGLLRRDAQRLQVLPAQQRLGVLLRRRVQLAALDLTLSVACRVRESRH